MKRAPMAAKALIIGPLEAEAIIMATQDMIPAIAPFL